MSRVDAGAGSRNGHRDEGTLPHDLDAERALLGAALLNDPNAIAVVVDVDLADFYKPAHRHVAEAVRALTDRGEPVEPVTVGAELTRRGFMKTIGGHDALVEIQSSCPVPSSAPRYAAIVQDKAYQRCLIAAAEQVAEAARSADPAEAIKRATQLAADPRYQGGDHLQYRARRMDTVESETVRWLWPGKLPRGMLVTLDGDPGAGKSTLCLDILARLTTGRAMPGEQRAYVQASSVVLLSAEDAIGATIRPRLEAAGADLARVHHLDEVPHYSDDGTCEWLPPTFPEDLGYLEAIITDTDAVLVVFDMMLNYLSAHTDSVRDQDMRRALTPLKNLAERTACCFVLLRHFPKSKRKAGQAIDAGTGAISIVGQARVGMVAAGDPNDETRTRKVLAWAKGNLSPEWPSLAYRCICTVCGEPCHHVEHNVVRIQWLGQSNHSGDSLLRPTEDEGERSALTEAMDWLKAMLSDGPLLKRDIVRAARVEDIKVPTLKRAFQELGVLSERDKTQQGRPATWRLPEQPLDVADSYGSQVTDHVMDQPPLIHNTHPSDQYKHGPNGGYGSHSRTLSHNPAASTCQTCRKHPARWVAKRKGETWMSCGTCREQALKLNSGITFQRIAEGGSQ